MAKSQHTEPPHFQGTYALPGGPQSARSSGGRATPMDAGGSMWLRRYHLAWPVLALSLIACERTQPVEPVFEASATAGSGAGVKAPSNIGAIAGSFSQISLSWQDNSSNEDGFEVQRATPWPSSPYTLRDNLPTNTIAFGDTGLTASTQYCYRVRAYQTKGRQTDFSAFSAAVCVTTQAPPPPPTPSAPSNVSAALVPGITVRVQWADNSSNEIGFRLERSADQVTWATVATIGPSSDASVSFIDDTWSIEQQACYRVFDERRRRLAVRLRVHGSPVRPDESHADQRAGLDRQLVDRGRLRGLGPVRPVLFDSAHRPVGRSSRRCRLRARRGIRRVPHCRLPRGGYKGWRVFGLGRGGGNAVKAGYREEGDTHERSERAALITLITERR